MGWAFGYSGVSFVQGGAMYTRKSHIASYKSWFVGESDTLWVIDVDDLLHQTSES